MKNVLIALLVPIGLLASASTIKAQNTFEASASLRVEKNVWDSRVYTLRAYLSDHNSPLASHAEDFVFFAEEYNVDWRLVPAIAGVESTFGKRIPPNSYNAYGWANGKFAFDSWDQSIEVVTSALANKYIARGAITTSQIGRIYAPPSSTWAGNVEFFKNRIEPLPVEFAL